MKNHSKNFISVLMVILGLTGCSRSNDLLLGRMELEVGSHTVVVTDCYRTEAPHLEKTSSGEGYHFNPCQDADIWIRDEILTVNEKNYGLLKEGDRVALDHGTVLINQKEVKSL